MDDNFGWTWPARLVPRPSVNVIRCETELITKIEILVEGL